jgi:hypothetical protein
MMEEENKPARMNPTTEKPTAASGIQNRFIARPASQPSL